MLMPIDRVEEFFLGFAKSEIDEPAGLILDEIRTRLTNLDEDGVGYLTLDRQSRTLSGGEVMRISLTTALGTSLVNTLFVLDEPSVGLHSRDIRRLISVLHRLRDAGNTLLVVEHDPEVIAAADTVIDMGPGPGELGGNIVFNGSFNTLLSDKSSLTAGICEESFQLMLTKLKYNIQPRNLYHCPWSSGKTILKSIDAEFPLHGLVVVSGVSGSGNLRL